MMQTNDFDDQRPTVLIPAYAMRKTQNLALEAQRSRRRPLFRIAGWVLLVLTCMITGGALWAQLATAALRPKPAPQAPPKPTATRKPFAQDTKDKETAKSAGPRPLPERAARSLERGRFKAALEQLPEGAPEQGAWRAQIREAWLARISRMRDTDSQLDALEQLLDTWPKDPKAQQLSQKARARHQGAIARLERRLSAQGLKAEVKLTSARRRAYSVHLDWTPSREMRAAMIADPAQVGMDLLSGFISTIYSSTKDCGFRTERAELRIAGTDAGWTLSTRCARQLATEKDSGKAQALWQRCLRTKRFKR